MQEHSYLIEYCQKVFSGEIVAGQELITELSKLYADTRDPSYKFDLTLPHKMIKFIESQCRHKEGRLVNKPFLLLLWQKAFVEAVFGFYIYDADLSEYVRRFLYIMLMISRKSGKTPLSAAILLAYWVCSGMGTNILTASCDYGNVDVIWDWIKSMIQLNPFLEGCTHINQMGIFWGGKAKKKVPKKFTKANRGFIKRMSAKGTGGKDARNLAAVVLDEVWAFQDETVPQALRQSLSTNPNALYLEITTEGQIIDGYLDRRMAYLRGVLSGEIDDDRTLPWLYTQDSEDEIWQDESSWYKSNPSLGTVKLLSYVRGVLDLARTMPSTRPSTLAKDFNIKQSLASAWLSYEVIHGGRMDDPIDLESFRGSWAIAGADLAETTDLVASVLYLRRPSDPTIYLYSHFFITKAKADSLKTEGGTALNPEGIDYYEWERQGWVTIMPGSVIEDGEVAEWISKTCKRHGIRVMYCGYDTRSAQNFSTRMNRLFPLQIGGQKAECAIPVWQSAAYLDRPMRALEADLMAGNVCCGGNPVMRWCLTNCSLKTDGEGRIQPAKMRGQSKNRIDGVAAALCAYAVVSWKHDDFFDRL
jgi:phage terminase large subunit-like protein